MKDEQPEIAKPVAYDAQGRPLYYQPPVTQEPAGPRSLVSSKPEAYDGHNFNPQLRTQYAAEPDFVHAKRSLEPNVPEVSDEIKRRHDDSVRRYPSLNLSEGEFVILQIRRHPIGLLIPIITTAFAITILTALAFLVPDFYARLQPTPFSGGMGVPSQAIIVTILMLLAFLAIVVGGIAVWVYQKNQFFMTNESVIQEKQLGLFSRHEQTVSLGSIEDASFRQQGILQSFFNYGSMRLSTEGEETTYRFAFVADPKKQIAIVSNAVESFKNGRPVNAYD